MKQKKKKAVKTGKAKRIIALVPKHLKFNLSPLPDIHTDEIKPVTKESAKAMILQAIELWNNKFSRTEKKTDPFVLMSRKTGDLLESLLYKQDKGDDWGAAMISYNHLLIEIISLLAKPGILVMLPEHWQGEAADMLNNLQSFFSCVDFDDTHAFLDWCYCSRASASQLQIISNYYDFTKRHDNAHGNHFFKDVASGRRQEENLQDYYNENFSHH